MTIRLRVYIVTGIERTGEICERNLLITILVELIRQEIQTVTYFLFLWSFTQVFMGNIGSAGLLQGATKHCFLSEV